MSIALMQYRYQSGAHQTSKTVLVDDSGTKLLSVLVMDGSLTVRKVPKTEERYMSPAPGKEKAMTTRIKQFRAYGRRHGMTKAAKSFLTRATKSA